MNYLFSSSTLIIPKVFGLSNKKSQKPYSGNSLPKKAFGKSKDLHWKVARLFVIMRNGLKTFDHFLY